MKDLINLYPPIQVDGREQVVSDAQQPIGKWGDYIREMESAVKMRRFYDLYPPDAPVRDAGPHQDSHGNPDEIWKSLLAGVHQIDIINKETFKRNKFGESEH